MKKYRERNSAPKGNKIHKHAGGTMYLNNNWLHGTYLGSCKIVGSQAYLTENLKVIPYGLEF